VAYSSWANSGNSLSNTKVVNYTQVENNVKKFVFINKNFQHVSPFLSLLQKSDVFVGNCLYKQ
jgi:hypothetical protein